MGNISLRPLVQSRYERVEDLLGLMKSQNFRLLTLTLTWMLNLGFSSFLHKSSCSKLFAAKCFEKYFALNVGSEGTGNDNIPTDYRSYSNDIDYIIWFESSIHDCDHSFVDVDW